METYPSNTLILTTPFQEQFSCTFLCNDDFDKRAVCYIVPILQVPTMPLAVGKEMLLYDEESNYYWKYVISEIVTIIGLNIICKFSVFFDVNFPLKYYGNMVLMHNHLSTPSMPLWYIESNSLIDPVADNGLFEVGGINFNYTYCIIKRMDFRSIQDSSILYCIRPLTDDEEINLDSNKIIPIIHIVIPEDQLGLESFDIWKDQFRNKKVRVLENSPEKEVIVHKEQSSQQQKEEVIVQNEQPSQKEEVVVQKEQTSQKEVVVQKEHPSQEEVAVVSEKISYDIVISKYDEQSVSEEDTSSETTNESSDSSIEELTTEILEEILNKVVGNVCSSIYIQSNKEEQCEKAILKPAIKKVRIRNRNKKHVSFGVAQHLKQALLGATENIKSVQHISSEETLLISVGITSSLVAPTTFGKSIGSASEQALLGPDEKDTKKDDFYEGYTFYNDLSINIDNIDVKNDKRTSISEPEYKNKKNKKSKKTVVNKLNIKQIDSVKSKKDDIILYIISKFEFLFSKIIEVNKLDKTDIYDKYITYAMSIVNNDNEIKDKDIYLNFTKKFIVSYFAKISNNYQLAEREEFDKEKEIPTATATIFDKSVSSQYSGKKIFEMTLCIEEEEKPKPVSIQTIPDNELLKYIPVFNEKFGDLTKSLDKSLKKELLIKFVTLPIEQFVEELPAYIRENNKNVDYLNHSKEKINNFKVIFKLEFVFDKLRARFMGDLKGEELIQRYLVFEPCCMKLLMQYYYPFLIDNTSTGKSYDNIFLSILRTLELHLGMLFPFFSPDLVNWDILQNPDIDSITKIMVRARLKVSELLETVHENLEIILTRDLSLYVANLFYSETDGSINQHVIRLGHDDELFIEKCITTYFNNIVIEDFTKRYNIPSISEIQKQTLIV
jgi:hypothetical protein